MLNKKVTFGDSDDLEIYHDSNHSYINDTGTGDLVIAATHLRLRGYSTAETYLLGTENGSVELYYDGSKKFETTSTGVTITGTATATEGLVLDGQTGSGKGLRLDLAGSGDYVIQETTTDDVVQFGGTGSSNFFVHNISNGRIGIATADPLAKFHIYPNASSDTVPGLLVRRDWGATTGAMVQFDGNPALINEMNT